MAYQIAPLEFAISKKLKKIKSTWSCILRPLRFGPSFSCHSIWQSCIFQSFRRWSCEAL